MGSEMCIRDRNDKKKAKLDSQENWFKVKVTGKGHRGQITIQNDSFQAVTSIIQKVLGRF